MLKVNERLTQLNLEGNVVMPVVKIEPVENLKGELENRVTRVGDGSRICLFDKTSHPKNPTDVVCPHFLELKWANGCYFNCSWCYLQGTYRFHPEWNNGRPNIKDYEITKLHLKTFIESDSRPEILNAGELSDSLLTEHRKKPFSHLLEEVFSTNHTKHQVLFLTKSNRVDNIVKLDLQKYFIMSFTLNAFEVAKCWEKGAPSVEKRIEAAKEVYDAGYEVRVRIDPMVPINNWQKAYSSMVDKVFSNIVPERITIGSLRGLNSTINIAKDKTWVPYMTEQSNWGKKIPISQRVEMYSTIIEYLAENYNFNKIALCKETLEIWETLGLDYRKIKCNCVL